MRYLLIITVPIDNADAVRKALAEAGVGKLGVYDSCSFSSRGTGRFRPLDGAHPAIGSVDKLAEVEEERIEAMVDIPSAADLQPIMEAIRNAHPYEEPTIHVVPMIEV